MAFKGDGPEITNLDAGNLTSGTVATARLGSGTASSSTFLRGDNTWAAAGGGGYAMTVFTSPGTWTKPATVKRIKVTVVGGGGVVRSSAPISPTFTAGGTSSFGAFISCTGGSATTNSPAEGTGGSATGGDVNLPGASGSAGRFDIPTPVGTSSVTSGSGAGTIFASSTYKFIGSSSGNNYGGGGCYSSVFSAGGAGAGAVAIGTIASPTIPGPVSVTVGAGGITGGPGPSAPGRSGNGGAGIVIVEEFY